MSADSGFEAGFIVLIKKFNEDQLWAQGDLIKYRNGTDNKQFTLVVCWALYKILK